VRLFDGRGLYLEIAPTGSRWWRFKYRFAGKEKRISLGVYPGKSSQWRTVPTRAWDEPNARIRVVVLPTAFPKD